MFGLLPIDLLVITLFLGLLGLEGLCATMGSDMRRVTSLDFSPSSEVCPMRSRSD